MNYDYDYVLLEEEFGSNGNLELRAVTCMSQVSTCVHSDRHTMTDSFSIEGAV